MSLPTSEQLPQYYPFDDDVLETVAQIADRQGRCTWQTLRDSLPDSTVFTPSNGKPVEVLDLIPCGGYDRVHVYHAPMANAVDPTMGTRIATLAAALPTTRIITVGNPGAPGQGMGKLPFGELLGVWNGDLRAAVEPTLEYLKHQGVDTAVHIGLSYGADKGAAAAVHANKYDHQVTQSVLIDPASVKHRSLIGLARDFDSTAAALGGYVEAAANAAYLEALALADRLTHGMIGYKVGLLRLSNLAIAHALAQGGFEQRLSTALDTNPDMRADILWGSASELAIHGLMVEITQRLMQTYGAERVSATVLVGQKHAMGYDIFLHTALILQSIKRAILNPGCTTQPNLQAPGTLLQN